MSKWYNIKASDFIDFNPKEKIFPKTLATKVAMDKLQPFSRTISGYEIAPHNGGSKFRNGDTVMARITPCLENGKTAKIDFLKKDEIGFGSTEFIVMRAKPHVSDENFIYYLAISPFFRNIAIQSMVGSSGRQRVQQSVLDNTVLCVPDLPEQVCIAKTLKCLDDKIENNTKINHHLEQMAQAIFKSWFIDFEPFGGEMPHNWEKGVVSDLGEVVGGGTPSKSIAKYYTNHGIAWITPKDLSVNKNKFISHGSIDITDDGLNNSSAKLMPAGTVLFSSRAPIGYIAISNGEICTNQGFKSIIPKNNIGNAFVYFFLIENLGKIENMASGSTFKEVSGGLLKSFPAIIPDKKILSDFQKKCMPIFSQQKNIENENKKLEELRDYLLPRLMSGELSVEKLTAIR